MQMFHPKGYTGSNMIPLGGASAVAAAGVGGVEGGVPGARGGVRGSKEVLRVSRKLNSMQLEMFQNILAISPGIRKEPMLRNVNTGQLS